MSAESEEAIAAEVERLRRQHPEWSIWYGRQTGHPAGVFHAIPKDARTSELAGATADELAAAIKTVEDGSAGEPTRQDQVAALEALEAEVRRLPWWFSAVPSLQTSRPYLAVYVHGAASAERAYVATRDGAWAYLWASGHLAHPVGDPAGAAQRITDTARRRQGRRPEGL